VRATARARRYLPVSLLPRAYDVAVSQPAPVITSVSFEPAGPLDGELDWLPGGRRTVHATFDDGASRDLFSFFTDELKLVEADFLRVTEAQARTLLYATDAAFLRS
jgi:hypothetical protein